MYADLERTRDGRFKELTSLRKNPSVTLPRSITTQYGEVPISIVSQESVYVSVCHQGLAISYLS